MVEVLEGRTKTPAAKTEGKAKTAKGTAPAPPDSSLVVPWDADYLYYTVREPFPSRSSEANLVFGKVTAEQPLTVLSQMPEHGVIFSDGVEQDYLEFASGTTAVVTMSESKGVLVQKP